MPGQEWVNFAVDILELAGAEGRDTHALVRIQNDPAIVGPDQLRRLFSRSVPPAVIYFPTGLYRFTTSVEFPESVTVLLASGAVLLPDDPPEAVLLSATGAIPGVVLTFRCSVRADLLQIFGRYEPGLPPALRVKPARPGAFVFLGNRQTELRPEWFGAIAKIQTAALDNSDAFNACFQAAHTDRLDLDSRLMAERSSPRDSGSVLLTPPTTLDPGRLLGTGSASRAFGEPRWDPPIPVVLSSHYFVQKSLRVGSFSVPGVANPARFVMRGEDGVGPGGGSASIQWHGLSAPIPMNRTLLEIRGEIGATIDNVNFNPNEFQAQTCVRMNVSEIVDPKQTRARAPGAISSFRRCTFSAGSRNAVEIKAPVTPDYDSGAAWEPIGRVVFDSCRLTGAAPVAVGSLPVSVANELKERVLLDITASEQLGISMVGCAMGLHNDTPNVRALGGKIFMLSCLFHSYLIRMEMGVYRPLGKDLQLRSEGALRAVPSTLTMVSSQSQSRNFMDRNSIEGGGRGWRGVTLVGVASSDAPPANNEWDPPTTASLTPVSLEPAEIQWQAYDPVNLAMLGCVMAQHVSVQGTAGNILNMANSFYLPVADNFHTSGSAIPVWTLLTRNTP